ncbi:MAG: hypothetical protein EBR82_14075 [Caulobacteraceae bacterium]|nr:hypothetical protein [Caulobacteraceae bacterium]
MLRARRLLKDSWTADGTRTWPAFSDGGLFGMKAETADCTGSSWLTHSGVTWTPLWAASQVMAQIALASLCLLKTFQSRRSKAAIWICRISHKGVGPAPLGGAILPAGLPRRGGKVARE